jgi:hypothetical protein
MVDMFCLLCATGLIGAAGPDTLATAHTPAALLTHLEHVARHLPPPGLCGPQPGCCTRLGCQQHGVDDSNTLVL